MTRTPLAATRLALAAAFALAACGGGGSSTPADTGPKNPAGLGPAQAWTGPLPVAATSPNAEFQQQLSAGELQVQPPRTAAQQRAEHAQRNATRTATTLRDDLALLTAVPEPGPALAELLARARAANDSTRFAEPVAALGGQRVRLLSLAQELAGAADAQRATQDPAALRSRYAAQYARLTAEQRSETPTPESLAGATRAQLAEALTLQELALQQMPQPDGTWLLPAPDPAASAAASPSGRARARAAPSSGNGSDTRNCTPSRDGVWANFYWPLRNFVTPPRDQGLRGTCWAFTAVGALESRERVVLQQTRNLSEQFLVNKVKANWDAEDFEDGYTPEKALGHLLSRNQVLPAESWWTYNGAYSRPAVISGDEDSYAGSCNGYNGSCSETAHQSPWLCSTFDHTFCGYNTITYGGAGVAASPVQVLWDGQGALPLATLRHTLASGVAVMGSFGVRRGFFATENGFVTDTRNQHLDDDGDVVSGAGGGHAVLIVGFIDRAAMQAAVDAGRVRLPGTVLPDVKGWFIIKNSWGCAGDAGYVYMPDIAVAEWFTRLSALDFGPARSNQWQEQNYLRPVPGAARASLRVETDLFSAAPPPGGQLAQLNVQLSSSVAGDRFSVTPTFGVALYRGTFSTPGPRRITVTAGYPGAGATQTMTLDINAENDRPELSFIASTGLGTTVGSTRRLAVQIRDRNEDGDALCSRAVWTVTAPDVALDGGTGCTQRVVFGAAGTRLVTVSVVDSDGGRDSETLYPDIVEAPDNPYPIISSTRLTTANVQRGPNCSFGRELAFGETLDLRTLPGSTGCNGLPNSAAYYASTVVDNPGGEPLTYVYELWVEVSYNPLSTRSSSDAVFPVVGVPYGNGSARDCGVRVRVEPLNGYERRKTADVWAGRCLLPPAVPH